ncbi:MAG: hypothetical protein QM775_18185 [Pirellulales bacterium]
MKFLAYACLALVVVEFGVRLIELSVGSSLSDSQRLAAAKLRPGQWVRGRYTNSWGYWDREFEAVAAPVGTRRIALLGDATLFAGGAETNVSSMLERLLPRTEVDHFAVTQGGPGEFLAQFQEDVIRRRPEQMIVCLSMAPMAVKAAEESSFARWHTLHLLQAIVGPTTAHAEADPFMIDLGQGADYDEYVRRRAATIDACRADAEDSQLRADQAAIARLAEVCARQQIPLKLVLVPGEFQLSPQLTASFARRREVEPATLDLELPQRRWRAFGEHLGVDVVDLLPALKASGEIVYCTNSAEWNDRGISLTAETIARGL